MAYSAWGLWAPEVVLLFIATHNLDQSYSCNVQALTDKGSCILSDSAKLSAENEENILWSAMVIREL